jgi:hypothetical protein
MQNQKFSFIVRSTILRGEKANKALDAIQAPNPHQMNRLIGYMPNGTKAMIAQRPGKGGMDFTKLMGGKVYAVAADGTSPVYEKDEGGKPTKVQKTEDGLPLFSSSGFYLLSSKDYPALVMDEYFTLLRENGAQVIMVSDLQVANAQRIPLESEFDFELVSPIAQALLADDQNLVARFDADINRKRSRGITRAQEEAQDNNETFEGPAFQELKVSKKDGNPVLVAFWQVAGQPAQSTLILREKTVLDDGQRPVIQYLDPAQAWDEFTTSAEYKSIVAQLDAGAALSFGFIQGHVMRTSVSFRRKVENVMAAPPEKAQFGDGVYIQGALRFWCRGIVSVIQSQHPNFPAADYDAHHYVAAVRQAEVGMNKKPDNTGWTAPQIVFADILDCVPKA